MQYVQYRISQKPFVSILVYVFRKAVFISVGRVASYNDYDFMVYFLSNSFMNQQNLGESGFYRTSIVFIVIIIILQYAGTWKKKKKKGENAYS